MSVTVIPLWPDDFPNGMPKEVYATTSTSGDPIPEDERPGAPAAVFEHTHVHGTGST